MENRREGSSRFSTTMRSTGGNNNGVLDKSSKKEKVRRLSEMDQLSHSITTNSTSKRVKLPKKFSDHCGILNLAPVPRKLRSAMKKRGHEPLKICTANKLKMVEEEHEDSKTSPRECIVEDITKDEEEVAEALYSLSQTFPKTKTSKAEPSSLAPQESIRAKVPKQVENNDDFKDVKNPQKRCSIHVYICNLIKVSQTKKYSDSSIGKGSNITPNTNPQKMSNECVDHLLNEAKSTNERPSLEARGNIYNVSPSQVSPYFDTKQYDCSWWSTLTKQQSWNNCVQTVGCKSMQNGSYNTTPPSSSSVETFGSKYVLESKQISNTEQQQQQHIIPISLLPANKGKMQFSYNKNGGSFLVDSVPTLKLTL